MIGHFLQTLDEGAEGRILTQSMCSGKFRNTMPDATVCLVEVALGWGTVAFNVRGSARLVMWRSIHRSVAFQYDALCRRFGEARSNAVVRNRILSNRARRVLTAVVRCDAEQVPA